MSTTLLYANLKLPRSVYCKFSCGGKTKPNFRFWPVYGQNKYRFQGTQKQVSTTIVLAPKKMSDLKSLIKFSPERKPAFLSFQKRWKHFSEKFRDWMIRQTNKEWLPSVWNEIKTTRIRSRCCMLSLIYYKLKVFFEMYRWLLSLYVSLVSPHQPFIKTHRPHFVTQSSKKFFQDNHNTNRRAGEEKSGFDLVHTVTC